YEQSSIPAGTYYIAYRYNLSGDGVGYSYNQLVEGANGITSVGPTTNPWELVAQKGDTGDAGPAGPEGPKGDTGDTGPTGPTATVPIQEWQPVTSGMFSNSWVNDSPAAYYRKTPDGRVYIKGWVTGGTKTANTVVFTLP
ncbi:UNVERIFIED_CONTAM: hypothetical protein NY603_17465, partial [Bacteroidetes bacterium 56_B9]